MRAKASKNEYCEVDIVGSIESIEVEEEVAIKEDHLEERQQNE
jgi:hypothetical protein